MSYLSIATGLMPNRIYHYDNGLATGRRRFKFIITDNGEIVIVNRMGECYRETDADDYWNVINYPENSKLVCRWTKEEVENAKAIKQLYPEATHVKQELFFNNTKVCTRVRYPIGFVTIYNNCFPSLKDGELVTLDEIIESEKYL